MITIVGTCSRRYISQCVVTTVERENEVSNRSFSLLTDDQTLQPHFRQLLCYGQLLCYVSVLCVFVKIKPKAVDIASNLAVS